jgi:hypothetical protein
VSVEDVDSVISALGDWLHTSEELLKNLEEKVAYTAHQSAEALAQKQILDAKIEEDKNLLKARVPYYFQDV